MRNMVLLLIFCMTFSGLGVSLKGGPQNPVNQTFTYVMYDVDSTGVNALTADYVCMGATLGINHFGSGIVGEVGNAYVGDQTNLCSTSGALKNWDFTDGVSAGGRGDSLRYVDHIKPPGVTWTARKLSCMLFGVPPTDSDSDDIMDLRVGWRDKDGTPTLTADPTITLTTEAAAIHIPVSADINLPISTKDSIAGMVVMISDPDEMSWTSANVVCTVSVDVI